jgi:hypothetical protein
MCSGKDGKDELVDPFTSEIMRINPEDKEVGYPYIIRLQINMRSNFLIVIQYFVTKGCLLYRNLPGSC